MNLTSGQLAHEAASTGFAPETLEKALQLLSLLKGLRSHPFLKSRFALKGGTALNLFIFEVPRLSVDIDLNYIGSIERSVMLTERPKFEEAVSAVCGREELSVKRVPAEHAGGKWRLSFRSASGGTASLELDVNFLLRVPLWRTATANSHQLGSFRATGVPLLDLHELAAGKLAALLSRQAPRDLFDTRELLGRAALDTERLRLAFVAYGGTNRKDWRKVSLEDIAADPRDVERSLLPMLRVEAAPAKKGMRAWTERLVRECRKLVSDLLPLRKAELDFISRLNERGEIAPELLTKDADMAARLRSHPGLRWKAINVRKHKNLAPLEPDHGIEDDG